VDDNFSTIHDGWYWRIANAWCLYHRTRQWEINKVNIGKHLMAAITSAVLFTAAGPASAAVLNFEGINTTYPSNNYAFVNNFYNGGTSSQGTSGPNLGIGFSANALAICLNTIGNTSNCSNTSRGGLGDPTSQRGGLFFLRGAQTYMNLAAGFTTGFSFFYAAINRSGSVSVFDGLNGTGNMLATLNLPTTPSACDSQQFGAQFCPFVASGIGFAGTAKSVSFAGAANQIVFDDVTFGSVTPGSVPSDNDIPEPGTLALFGLGLAGLGFTRRRRAV
jgi:hypothetical protein